MVLAFTKTTETKKTMTKETNPALSTVHAVRAHGPAEEWNQTGCERNGVPVPAVTMGTLHAYMMHGRPPGSFVTAVLANDLRKAVGRADHGNIAALASIVCVMHNRLPSQCWGSPTKVRDWIEAHTLARDEAAQDAPCGPSVASASDSTPPGPIATGAQQVSDPDPEC